MHKEFPSLTWLFNFLCCSEAAANVKGTHPDGGLGLGVGGGGSVAVLSLSTPGRGCWAGLAGWEGTTPGWVLAEAGKK